MPRLNRLEQATTGYAACWFDQTRTIANDHGSEIRLSDDALIAARRCNFVYANGVGQWMAFHSPANGSPVIFGPGFEIPESGMPLGNGSDPVGPDGSIIYKRAFNSAGPYGFLDGPDIPGDFDQIQNLGGHRAIGVHNGVIRGFNVEIPDNTKGTWPVWKNGALLYQASTGELVLSGRVVGPAANYFRPDFNRRPDGSTLIVWSSTAGELDVLRRVLAPGELATLPLLAAPNSVPVPQPPPEPKPVPDNLPDPGAVKAALQVQRDKYPAAVIGDAEMGAILNAVALQFPHMGMHRKNGQATQPGTGIGISHDVLRVMPPGDPLGYWSDVLGAAGAGLASALAPEWKRSSDGRESFVEPVGAQPVPMPGPDLPTTHRYNGGGNDTGECDTCHLSRFDPVHRVPESLVKHQYDGGEQDTGLCDVCQKDRAAVIHQEVLPGPAPDPDPTPTPDAARFEALEARVKALEARPAFSGTVRIAAIDLTLEGLRTVLFVVLSVLSFPLMANAQIVQAAPTRDSLDFEDAEKAGKCFLSWQMPRADGERLVEMRCPAPFSPYGVSFHRFCLGLGTLDGVWKPDAAWENGQKLVGCRDPKIARTTLGGTITTEEAARFGGEWGHLLADAGLCTILRTKHKAAGGRILVAVCPDAFNGILAEADPEKGHVIDSSHWEKTFWVRQWKPDDPEAVQAFKDRLSDYFNHGGLLRTVVAMSPGLVELHDGDWLIIDKANGQRFVQRRLEPIK